MGGAQVLNKLNNKREHALKNTHTQTHKHTRTQTKQREKVCACVVCVCCVRACVWVYVRVCGWVCVCAVVCVCILWTGACIHITSMYYHRKNKKSTHFLNVWRDSFICIYEWRVSYEWCDSFILTTWSIRMNQMCNHMSCVSHMSYVCQIWFISIWLCIWSTYMIHMNEFLSIPLSSRHSHE